MNGSPIMLVAANFDSRCVHMQGFAEQTAFAYQHAAELRQGAMWAGRQCLGVGGE